LEGRLVTSHAVQDARSDLTIIQLHGPLTADPQPLSTFVFAKALPETAEQPTSAVETALSEDATQLPVADAELRPWPWEPFGVEPEIGLGDPMVDLVEFRPVPLRSWVSS
jgi:hypothetical protein